MVEPIKEFFSGSFMAHGNCFLWKPELVWLHAGSDFLIGLAYYSIPLMLIYFIGQRKDIPFPGVFLLFSAFILSCGTGHWLEIWTLWHPDYWLSGLMKGITAVVSLYTASEMLPLIPKALALPSPAELEAANLALVEEVTEHQQTIEALRASQQRLSLLVQQTPLAVIEWDIEGRVREWNPAAERIFGYNKSEAIGSHAAELVLPQCCQDQFETAWQNLLLCHGDSCCTNEHRTKEEKAIFCDWYNTPLINAQGKTVGFASLAQDVTKRKEAEDALRQANEELEDRVKERTKQLAQANEVLHTEINERRLAESALRESKKRLHTVVTQAPIILYATDRTGKITLVEGKGLERLGLEQSRLVGLSVFRLCLGKRQTLDNLRQVLGGTERAWTVKADDSVYESRATPIWDNNNQVIGIIGVATDISERHRIQSALAERERYLAALVEVQNQLLALSGEESCQSPILKMLGESAQASRVSVFKKSQNGLNEPSIIQCGYWSVSTVETKPQSDSLLYDQCLSYWQERLAQGEKIMGLVKDLPEPERLILQQQEILSILVLPLIVKEQFFGLIAFENCTDEQVWSASAVDLLRAAAAAISLHQQRSQAEMALRLSEAQLRERTTQQEQTLQQLRQTQAQLVQSEKMSSLGMMVAGIAHEINNPVSFVYGNIGPASEYIRDLLKLISLYQQHYPQPVAPIRQQAETIELDFLIEDLPKLLDSMKIGSERIRDLVVSLRTFSRLDEAEMKRVDIHECLESTLRILQHRLKEKPGFPGIEVIKNYGDLPVVECYPGQLNQVFMNIIANAIDVLESQRGNSPLARSKKRQFRPSPWLEIETEVVNSSTSSLDCPNVLIKIKDNGQGMTEDVKQRLFDPFFTTKPVGKGTGLGLSISYQIIVGKHQGQLKCLSVLGQGTEFIIQIPIRQRCSALPEKMEMRR